MRTHLCIVLSVAVIFGVAHAGDDSAKESAKLAGTWEPTAAEDYGQKLPEEQVKNLRLVLTGDEFTTSDGDTTVMKGNFKIDPVKKPKRIDLKSTSGRHKGKTLEGIYELDGDSLKICFVEPGGKRPKELTSTLDNSAFLLVCKRKKQ
jgi:uncharacterized protein (TIGR03067 family)